MRIILLIVMAILLLMTRLFADEFTENIRLNQIGFYPNGPKLAVVVDAPGTEFVITSEDLADTLFEGQLGPAQVWAQSEESVSKADFSVFAQRGIYRLAVPGLGYSYPFEISYFIHQKAGIAALKSYYFQRMSIPLEEEFAGIWQRKMGHPDDKVYVHASAATPERPTDTIIACPRGWYDAGDYNKYIVNSGISTYQILATYEQFPEYCAQINANIPESKNNVPDIFDEALWNIRWMLTMQDPYDGGVYHKCTCTNFQGFVMPHQATARRYVVQKSTTAAFDFAAVMAVAHRIFKNFEDSFPGLADSCLNAAMNAWQWGKQYPDSLYRQSRLNELFNPDISTGEYGDSRPQDEHDWAAMELYVSTQADSFLTDVKALADPNTYLPGWSSVSALGFYSMAQHLNDLTAAIDKNALRGRIIGWANWLRTDAENSPYHIVFGKTRNDLVWGSNAVAANQCMGLLQAFRLSNDSTFLWNALDNLDYLLGRNAVNYCFVTGYGDKSPMFIHHRQSGSDRIPEPVPGFLAGGPNPGQQDKSSGVNYPSNLPAKSYVDVQGSWASNEICINWNAPLVYTIWAIEAIMSPDGNPGTAVANNLGPSLPQNAILYPNYPNPFNPVTSIRYQLRAPANVKISIVNLSGQTFRVLENSRKSAGNYLVQWDGTDENGMTLSSGMYLCYFQANKERRMTKLMLVK